MRVCVAPGLNGPWRGSAASRTASRVCLLSHFVLSTNKQTNKLHGLSSRANYTDRATAACRRSDCQLLRIEGLLSSTQCCSPNFYPHEPLISSYAHAVNSKIVLQTRVILSTCTLTCMHLDRYWIYCVLRHVCILTVF
jgi:hypothetical protein